MQTTKQLIRSFAGGIVGPELFGRLDLAKFQTGLAKALNWWVLPHGPAQNRPGFQYILEAFDSTRKVRVIPFSFNTEQTFVLEFGHQYVRFHTNGATLLEAGLTITAISQANPGVLTYTGTDPANGDWMYLSGIGGMTELNGRWVKVAGVNTGANTFQLTSIHGGANIDTSGFGAYTSGGTTARAYTLTTLYDEDDLFDIHFTQSADVLTLVHPSYPPQELRRSSASEWEFVTISTTPTITPPTIGTGTGTPETHDYVVTALVKGKKRVSLSGEQVRIYYNDVETLPSAAATCSNDLDQSGAFNAISWPNQIANTTGYRVYKKLGGVYRYLLTTPSSPAKDDGSVALSEGVTPPVSGAAWSGGAVTAGATTVSSGNSATPNVVDTTTTYSYVITAVGADGSESYRSAVTSCTNNLATAGRFNTISWASVGGAERYNVYKNSNGVYGYIGQAVGTTFKDDNITADVSRTPPIEAAPFTNAGEYPGAVGYFEQRRCFAGSANGPQNFWATKSGTESNLSSSIPTRDDDAISFRITSREVNRIRHIVGIDQLILLTSGGEWKVAPLNSDVLTPTSAAPKQFAAEGASNVQPVVTGSSVIYVQESGSRVRELKANQYDTRALDVRDITVMTPHLVDGYTMVDMAYSKAPYKMVWVVRSDGGLLGLTYLPEQEVLAWHQHDTEGAFESVACVKEGSEHVLYAVVKRTVDEREVRYIERLHTRRFSAREHAFFVDSGLTYDGSATDTITGLWHLEGREVACLADGAEVTGLTVENGTVTLPQEASVVHIGLPITADLQTMPLSFEAEALGQGVAKNINEASLRVFETSGLLVGHNFNESEMQEITTRSGEPYDSPPDLITGLTQGVTILPEWAEDPQLCIRQRAPLPATVLALVLEVAVGG